MNENMFGAEVGNFIFNVAFNSAGGWDWSESFRVVAVTRNWVAAIASGDGCQHNSGHNAASGCGHEPQQRIIVSQLDIDEDGAIFNLLS